MGSARSLSLVVFYLIKHMFDNPFAAIAAGAIAGFSLVAIHANIVNHVAALKDAEVQQCRTMDWPAEKHEAMMSHCIALGVLK